MRRLYPVALLLLLALFETGRVPLRSTGEACASTQNPLEMRIELTSAPSGEWVARIAASAHAYIPDAYVKFVLPEGARALTPVTWRGALAAGGGMAQEVRIDAAGLREFEVSAGVYAMGADGAWYAARRAWAAVEDTPAGPAVAAPERPLPGFAAAREAFTETPSAAPVLNVVAERAGRAGTGPNAGNATRLAYGDARAYRLLEPGASAGTNATSRVFRFYARPGDFVRIAASARQFDPALRLYSPDGALVALNDDADSLDARIPERSQLELSSEGYYTVEVSGAGAGVPLTAATDEFTLRLERTGQRVPLDQRVQTYLAGQGVLAWNAVPELQGELTVERSCNDREYQALGRVSSRAGQYELSTPSRLSGNCSYRLVNPREGWSEATTPLTVSLNGGTRASTTVTASGRFTYNFEGQTLGIRRASVYLLRADGNALLRVASGGTDDAGRFSIPFPLEGFTANSRLFARVFAVDAAQQIGAVVNTESAQSLVYALDTDRVAVPQTATALQLGEANAERVGANPQFYIYDSIVEGYRLSDTLLGYRPPVPVNVGFPARNREGQIEDSGAWYVNNVIMIGRKLPAARDVVLHEYGHFLADKGGFNQSQGGPHFFPFRSRVNASLAWGESWATFFSVAGQFEAGRLDTAYDSEEIGGGFRYDMENGQNPEVIAQTAMGDDNEGSVQFVLWDLWDGGQDLLPNAGAGIRDTVKLGIRDVFAAAAAGMMNVSDQRVPVNLMIRYYASLHQNVAAAGPLGREIAQLYADQRINFAAPPAAPTDLRATSTAAAVTLAWNAATGQGVSFELQRRGANDAQFSVIGRPTAATFTDTAPPAGNTQYRVRTRTVLTGREQVPLISALSAAASVQPAAPPAGRRRIGVGQTLTGMFTAETAGRAARCPVCAAEVFELTLAAAQQVTITMTSGAFDSYLVLSDAAGSTLASDDDGAGNRNARITRQLAAGTYLIEASSSLPGGAGLFELSVAAAGTAAPPAQRTLQVGQTVQGGLSPASGRSSGCPNCFADLYYFNVTTAQTLTIDLRSAAFDAFLILADANGAKIAVNDDGGGGTDARIVRNFAPGAYRIEATTFGANASGPYTLSLTAGAPAGAGVREVALGQSVSGSLHAGSQRSSGCGGCFADVYELVLASPVSLDLVLTSSDFDAFLRLTNAAGQAIAADNDGGGGTNARIVRSLAAGTYRVEATSFKPGVSGAYELRVDSATVTVNRITPGEVVNGQLSTNSPRSSVCPACYADVYEFTITSTRFLSFSLSSTVLDAYLQIFNEQGSVVASDDDSGGGRDALIAANFAPGTYRLEASTFLQNATGSYRLEMLAPDLRIRTLAVGEAVTANLTSQAVRSTGCYRCYADLYQFTIPSAQVLNIGMSSNAFDAYLLVKDAAGAVLAADDDSGGGSNARITRTFPAGTYLIEATTYLPASSGAYRITLEAAGGTIRRIQLGETITGNLTAQAGRSVGCNGCYADLYEFSLTQTQTVVVNMNTRNATALDPYLQLLDSLGAVLATDDDSGGGVNARIVRTLAAGTYRVEATTATRGQSGPYTIEILSLGGTPRALQIGAPDFNGNLSAASGRSIACKECPTDAFEFRLTTAQAVDLVLNSSQFQVRMRLLDSQFRTVVTSERNETGGSARIARLLEAGAYRLEVSTAGVAAGGTYTLRAIAGAIVDIRVGEQVSGNLNRSSLRSVDGPAFFADLYRLTITGTAQTLLITQTSNSFDSFLALLSSNARVIVSNDDIAPGNRNSGIVITLGPGTYYIEASSYLTNANGPYTVSVTQAPRP